MASARVFHHLMVHRLGLGPFLAQGGDWGSLVVSNLARLFPRSLLGVHLNLVLPPFATTFRQFLWAFAGSLAPRWVFSDPNHFANYDPLGQLWELIQESGYMHIQVRGPGPEKARD